MDLKEEIRRYVLDNEHAAETAGGVMRAWLKLTPGECPVAIVEQTLLELVSDGFLERHALPGGAVIYRRAHPGLRS
jgi:hypothetical protein